MNRFPTTRTEAVIYFSGKGDNVLDIGCGNGGLLYQLRNNYTNLYGTELDEDRVNDAIKNCSGLNAVITKINIENKSDFPDNFFDLIITCDVIEHIYDVFKAYNEISRILKPGGKIITVTPNIAYFKRRLTLLSGKFPSTSAGDEGFKSNDLTDRHDGAHIHYFTFRMIEKLYKKYNLKVVKKIGYGRLGFIHNIYPALLSPSCLVIGTK